MERMTAKGFLLLDQKGNTLLIAANEEWLHDFLRNNCNYQGKQLDRIKVHKNQKELFEDIRAYLKGWYE